MASSSLTKAEIDAIRDMRPAWSIPVAALLLAVFALLAAADSGLRFTAPVSLLLAVWLTWAVNERAAANAYLATTARRLHPKAVGWASALSALGRAKVVFWIAVVIPLLAAIFPGGFLGTATFVADLAVVVVGLLGGHFFRKAEVDQHLFSLRLRAKFATLPGGTTSNLDEAWFSRLSDGGYMLHSAPAAMSAAIEKDRAGFSAAVRYAFPGMTLGDDSMGEVVCVVPETLEAREAREFAERFGVQAPTAHTAAAPTAPSPEPAQSHFDWSDEEV
ncbi:hypothetical protein [Nocardioides sp. KR10-350]|uniref:hypothetical protein n=1 Tax=Nocardioides cheoyonin TaxID=3156615 RepID=UPI0032B626EB